MTILLHLPNSTSLLNAYAKVVENVIGTEEFPIVNGGVMAAGKEPDSYKPNKEGEVNWSAVTFLSF
jgi:hypothetical protein